MSLLEDLACVRPVGLTPSDSTTFLPPLMGIEVFAPGNVTIVTDTNRTEVLPFPSVANGGCYPCRYWGRIWQVKATGTDVGFSSTNLKGLRKFG